MELKIEHLSKHFKDKNAVDDVCLTLTPGVWGLLGANGAGKTTLMRMIADIMTPTSGTISYDGTDIHIMDEPTAALAVAEVEAVLELIRRVSARGVSVILITHRLQDLFLVCDRIMVMYEGTNVADRRVADTSLSDIVNLIVGEKFTARSAAAH